MHGMIFLLTLLKENMSYIFYKKKKNLKKNHTETDDCLGTDRLPVYSGKKKNSFIPFPV